MGLASLRLWARLQGSAVSLLIISHLSVNVDTARANTPQCQNGLCAVHEHTVDKRSVGSFTQWTQWSPCSLGQSTRERTCKVGCSATSNYLKDQRLCSAGTIVPTTARTHKPTDSNDNTDAKSPLLPTTRPITILNDHTSTAPVKTSARKPVTINPPFSRWPSTVHWTVNKTAATATRRPWFPMTTGWERTLSNQNGVTTPYKSHSGPATSSAVTTSSRTDNYNLRITVAISSALVGSLLLVAVVACWRRLHLEQQEQRRQLMQPEATQPEYHGLPGPRQASFPAPPPNYHDAFQIDSQQIQAAAAAPSIRSSTSGSGLPGTVSQSDGPPVHSSLLPPPFVPIAPASPWPTQPRPPPAPPSSPTASSTGGGGGGGPSNVVAAREKSHVTYIVSHLKSGVTADESIEEEETSLDSDMLLRANSSA